MIIGLLPLAGSSTRLGGVPKFALPLADISMDKSGRLCAGETLISRHLRGLLEVADHVVIAASPKNIDFLEGYLENLKITVICLRSKSLSETLTRAAGPWLQSASRFIVQFPDTVFSPWIDNQALYSASRESDLTLGLWPFEASQRGRLGQIMLDESGTPVAHRDKDIDCRFPYVWGSLVFSPRLIPAISEGGDSLARMIDFAIEHPDYKTSALLSPGRFFDLGTPDGLREYLVSL